MNPARPDSGLRLAWHDDMLTVDSPAPTIPPIEINYLEALCRPGSHERDWAETVIPHQTARLSADADGRRLELQSVLADGVVVRHTIQAGADEVDFRLVAHNPTPHESQVHWAQPCIRVGPFAGVEEAPDPDAYLRQCFVFLGGRLARMPTPGWATTARYTPGQVWCPVGVPRADVNPRPLNAVPPSNGLIGCLSRAGTHVLATAWEPYQELFQGIVQCIHADFRIGGLAAGEHKAIRGKLYLVAGDVDSLLARYRSDFPEHQGAEQAGVLQGVGSRRV
jgi:hypothetical protein